MSLPPLVMTDPKAARDVGDLLLEEDMENDEVVAPTPTGASYLAGATSSD